jgi:2-succinyl-5-enolpyruvyl-6-hydroxy-3-cyclohexene-1-carboxylate synthase
MSTRAVQTVWADLLLRSFADAGIREVIVSPGSRSTPLVLAALQDRRLRVHDVIDERSAAFFALGCARATGVPSLVVCTSGTAGAHHYPAVIEAGMSFTPMVVLTADRPFELQACGALQTIDQLKLFGDQARAFFELGQPDSSLAALRRLSAVAAQAVSSSLHPLPGAVHLNVKARKPLEPELPHPALPESHPPVVVVPRLMPPREAIDELAERCRRARRGLIVVGPLSIREAAARERILHLAKMTHFPIIADATSQLRFVGASLLEGVVMMAAEPLLGSQAFRSAHAPDLILQLGPVPTASSFDAFIRAHPHAHRVVIAPFGFHDPSAGASMVLQADIEMTVEGLSRALGRELEERAWTGEIERCAVVAATVVEAEVLRGERGEAKLSEGSIVREALRRAPKGSLVVAANGLSIRHLDTFCPNALNDVLVISQRGASGIDGLISGAAGSACASGLPTTLIVGDVGFLHDIGGLFVARRVRSPLVIVVLDNQGGRIFEQLPLIRDRVIDQTAVDHWITAPQIEMRAAADLFGVRYHRADSIADLGADIEAAHQQTGCTIVQAVVEPHDADLQRRRMDAALTASLGLEEEHHA